MVLAQYKDLCIDAVDARRNAGFWSTALGLRIADIRPDTIRLDGPTPQHTVWINSVPESHSVKNRVHIDVNTESVQQLVEAGAQVIDHHSFPWAVLSDPDGGELCAFTREPPVEQRLYEMGVDCVDPSAQSQWWQDILGGQCGHNEKEGWFWVKGINTTPFESIVFAPVPEPKTVKNRVHIDVYADVQELLSHGAQHLAQHQARHVLADPEGNEFCVFPQR